MREVELVCLSEPFILCSRKLKKKTVFKYFIVCFCLLQEPVIDQENIPEGNERNILPTRALPVQKVPLVIPTQKRRVQKPVELQETRDHMNSALKNLNNVLQNKKTADREDDADLYGKLIAQKLRAYSEIQRQEIMLEIDGLLLKKRIHLEELSSARPRPASSPYPPSSPRPSSQTQFYINSPPSSSRNLASPSPTPDLINSRPQASQILPSRPLRTNYSSSRPTSTIPATPSSPLAKSIDFIDSSQKSQTLLSRSFRTNYNSSRTTSTITTTPSPVAKSINFIDSPEKSHILLSRSSILRTKPKAQIRPKPTKISSLINSPPPSSPLIYVSQSQQSPQLSTSPPDASQETYVDYSQNIDDETVYDSVEFDHNY